MKLMKHMKNVGIMCANNNKKGKIMDLSKTEKMTLRMIKDTIADDSSVYIQTASNGDKVLPLYYDTWAEAKGYFKEKAWDEEIELRSFGGIMIMFKNL